MKIGIFDIEANGRLIDATKIHCIAYKNYSDSNVTLFGPDEIDKGIDELLSCDRLVAHNGILYDIPVVEKLLNVHLPRCVDTILISRVLYPDRFNNPVGGHSLKAWGKHLGTYKDDYSLGWDEYTESMGEYCKQDVVVTAAIFDWFKSKNLLKTFANAFKLEHDTAYVIKDQMLNGIHLNQEELHSLIDAVRPHRDSVVKELQELFPPIIKEMKTPAYWSVGLLEFPTKTAAKQAGFKDSEITKGPNKTVEQLFNPASGDQIVARFREKYNWKPTKLTKSGKIAEREGQELNPIKHYSSDDDALKDLDYPEAKLLRDCRILEKRLSQADEWNSAIQPDGKIYGSIITNGAVTGRMSHSNPNLAQIPKIKSKERGWAGKYGYECRSCFVPRPGWWMVGADASGLELRMLAHFLYPYDKGEYVTQILEGDVHSYNQEAAGLPTRDNAKTFIYGWLYGAGSAKVGLIVDGTPADGQKLIDKFLDSLPAVRRLRETVSKQVQQNGYLLGLDGRHLPIRKPHAALNTLLQSAGALVMKKALVLYHEDAVKRFGRHGSCWAYLLNVHDEVQQEAERQELAEEMGRCFVNAIKRAGESFKLSCPLDGEYKVGKSWAECH